MNERIQELWAKAVDIAVPETYTSLSWGQIEKIKTVFAQLIVKECVKCCEHESNDDEYDQFDMGQSVKAENIKTAIKQHFGVEE